MIKIIPTLRRLIPVCVLLVLSVVQSPGLAQQLPVPSEPGRRPASLPELPKKIIDLEWITVVPGGIKAPPRLAGEIVRFNDLIIDGLTAYAPEDLVDIFQASKGKDIPFGKLYDFARAIQKRYQADGYLLSFTFIPPQRVKDGIYRITVVEGYVSRIIVEGTDGWLKQTVAKMLAGITGSRPLRSRELERHLLLINDLKGITASGVLRPATEGRGASDLYVKVAHKYYDLSAQVDNRGSKYTGTRMATFSAGLNSVLGLGENFSATVKRTISDPRELKSIDLTYAMPIGSSGLNVLIAGGLSYSIPGYTLKELNVKTRTTYGEFDLAYPIVRTRQETLIGSLGYTHRNTTVKMLGERFSRDRLRLARAGLGYTNRELFGGVSGLNLNITQGLPFFNASDPDDGLMSRADAKTSFTKFGLSLAHARPLPYGVGLAVSASTQYSIDPLPSSEEYAAGGSSFGRAYDEGEISGEHGAAISFELGRVFRLDNSYIFSIRPYWFYDFGIAWDEPTESSTGGRASLASSGVGVSADFIYGLKLNAEFARPLTRRPSTTTPSQNSDRYTISLRVDF